MMTAPAGHRHRPAAATRLHESVVQEIVRRIVGGSYAPGGSLPSEPELAHQFGVSRTVVREAVRVLAAKGLVAVRQGSGMRVRPRERWSQLDPLVLFERARIEGDQRLLEQLLEVRRLIEVDVAGLAAERRTEDDLVALHDALVGMRSETEDLARHVDFDVAFHAHLFTAARNPILREMARPVIDLLNRARRSSTPGHAIVNGVATLEHHEAIYAAVAAGDPAAARAAMHAHSLQFGGDIRRGLFARDEQTSYLTGPAALVR